MILLLMKVIVSLGMILRLKLLQLIEIKPQWTKILQPIIALMIFQIIKNHNKLITLKEGKQPEKRSHNLIL